MKVMLVQEEGRLKNMIDYSAHLTLHERAISSMNKKRMRRPLLMTEVKIHNEIKCFFYKNSGHLRNDCPKQKAWFEKKSILNFSMF